jgi:hypothetical protein
VRRRFGEFEAGLLGYLVVITTPNISTGWPVLIGIGNMCGRL